MLVNEHVLSLLELLGCGGLLLDKNGRVLQTNEKARRYLGSKFNFIRRSSRSDLPNQTVQLALRSALTESTKILPLLTEYIVVPRANERPLILRRLIFPDAIEGDDGAIAAVIVLDMNDCPLPNEDLLAELFVLTPAEIRLAQRLSCGMDLGRIAKEVGVARETLRAQLKTLFLKTGTHRQAELVALLAHLARLPSQEEVRLRSTYSQEEQAL